LYVGRRDGEIPRPPRTLVQQREVVRNLTVKKSENVNVVNNINITHIRNVTALTPLRQAKELRLTALSAFARPPGVETRPAVKTQAI
jgi:hypothetical protein